jgi:hypothetical protein
MFMNCSNSQPNQHNDPNQRRLATFASQPENSSPSAAFGLLCRDRLTINFDFVKAHSTVAEVAGLAHLISPLYELQGQAINLLAGD